MIQWANKLYISDSIKNIEKVQDKINSNKLLISIYCIAFASNPNNLFDIYDSKELLFPYYRNQEIFIVGLSKSKEEAIFLVEKMLLEIYNNTGDFKVAEYFK